MIGLINPWVIVGWLASIGTAAWFGYGAGQDAEVADQSRVVAAVTAAGNEAATKAAEKISKIEVKHVVIRQSADTVIREVPVYRDCRHDARVLRDINAARGYEPEPAGGGVMPAASAPQR